MAISYAVNGSAITGGIIADWPKMITSQDAKGATAFSSWYRHVWRIPVLEMADWEILYPLRGLVLTSVTTTTQATPNTGNTYNTAYLMDLRGRQEGRQMVDIVVTFLIDSES